MKRRNPFGLVIYLVILVLFISVLTQVMAPDGEEALSYAQVLDAFRKEEVKEFTLTAEGDLVMMTAEDKILTAEIGDSEQFHKDLDGLIKRQYDAGKLEDFHYPKPEEPSVWSTIAPYLIIGVVLLAVMIIIMRRTGGGQNPMAKFTKANARSGSAGKKVTFQDVAGADEEKEELREVVEFLRDPDRFTKLGARIPKGILLVGPPGTGKTLLAKAVAGEADVQFLSISGSDFVEMYVGVGASRVRDLFEQAKKTAPAIVFIDEIDAVGRRRGAGLGGGHDEREQTLNQLLVEMDGFGKNEGVIVMAATNRKDILDPALLRPGRFDRQIYVGAPDWKGREEILKVHAKDKPLAEDVDLGKLAKATTGFTGADLENLLNEAALLAAREKKPFVAQADLEEAVLKVIAGPEKRSRVVSEHARKLTAIHEAGHAVAMYYLPTHDPVHQITIIPRGGAGGMTISLPEDDRSYRSRNEMFEQIVSFLGGRVAEKLFLDDISTGASNDIERATELARDMITRYGMSEAMGTVSYGDDGEVFLGAGYEKTRSYSEASAAKIDEEVRMLMDRAFDACEKILAAHGEKVQSVAAFLLEHETMNAETFKTHMEN